MLDPVGLHPGLGLQFPSRRIRSTELEPIPSPVAGKCVIINRNTDTWPIRPNLGQLSLVGFRGDSPVAEMIVPNIDGSNAARDQVEFAVMPNPAPIDRTGL